MSEPTLSQLLDRAVHHAPPMDLATDELLAAGRGRVRRRRAAGAGGVLGAVAVVAAVWGGLAGGAGSLQGTTDLGPAGPVWEQGEVVDAALFTGLQTIDDEGVEHLYDGRLTRSAGTGPVVLELSDGGAVVERIPAESPVQGLEVFAGERMTVALWAEPEGVVSSVPLVGPVDPGGPAGRTQGPEISGEQTAYAVWPAGVAGLSVPDQVRDVYLIGRDEVAALSGAGVESAQLRAGGQRALAWSDPATGVWGYAVDDQAYPVLVQLGDQPAQTSGYVASEDGFAIAVHLLPEGASVRTDEAVAGRVDSAVLSGREVVLAEARGDDAPDVSFRLGQREYTGQTYQDDLLTLDLGSQLLSPAESLEQPGALQLLTGSGERSVLTLGAEELEQGLVTSTVDGRSVVVATGWDGGAGVLADARVELDDGSGPRWVVPDDVAQIVLTDGRLVSVLVVDLAGSDQVVTVGRRDGDQVQRWEPPVLAAGVEWRQVDGAPVPFVEGRPLARVADGPPDGVRHYAEGQGSARGYVVLQGQAAGATFVPLLEGDGELLTAPEMVHQMDEVEVDGDVSTVLTIVGGLDADGRSTLAGVAAQRAAEGAANTWTVVGDASSAHLVVDPGLVVTLGAEQGVWLVHPTGSVDPAQLQAGRIGQDLALLGIAPGTESTLVAVHPEDAPAPRVGVDDGQLEPVVTHRVPQLDLVVRVWTLTGP
ncbi:hypothetical protein [Ornithinimicrobium cerasi]|uniref:Uncharacterized protein n=1 Tax=Ornithinimicrobium cerasi TaxID=2248773 RepID=A0A285VL68_9MICO|nr:hypothetical protein [Ornithinimicrobium cerasi]SOC53956.1 hypothetical protein SAMN05421879_102284 [Ornithinimicrobium cerasi]